MLDQTKRNGKNGTPADTDQERISIIMPARNEGENLRRTINSLLANTFYPDFEVLILDDASEDGCGEFLRRPRYANDQRLRLIRYETPQGLPALWQEGVALARGSILQFAAAHSCFNPYWLTNLYARLRRHDFQALIGAVAATLDPIAWKSTSRQRFGWTWDRTLQSYQPLRYNEIWPDCQTPWLSLGQMMISRKAYDEIGGLHSIYHSHKIREQDFCLRAYALGYDCHLEPTALIGTLEPPKPERNLMARSTANAQANAEALDYFTLVYLNLGEEKFEALCAPLAPEFSEAMSAFEQRRPQLDELRRRTLPKPRRPVEELLARLEPSPATTVVASNGPLRPEPMVSIVITAVNEGSYVQRTVDSILQNTAAPAFEIILVDDASHDDSFAFLEKEPYRSDPRLRYERFNYSAGMIRARHHGAASGRGDYILIMDAHMSVPEGWLAALLAAHLRWGPASVVAPKLGDINKADWSIIKAANQFLMMDEKFDFAARDFPYAIGLSSVFSGGCFLINRDFYFRIGGIDAGLRHWGCENIDLSMKVYAAGGAVFYEPSVVVGHLWKREVKRNVGYGFDFYYNKLRTGFIHLPYRAFNRLFANLKALEKAPKTFQDALRQYELNLPELHYQRQRQKLANRRNPDWYVRMFLPQLFANKKRKNVPRCLPLPVGAPPKNRRNGQLKTEEPLAEKAEVAALED